MKCKCFYLRKQQIIENLKILRAIQVWLMYVAMGLKDPTDDIAVNIGYARIIFYKDPAANTIFNFFEADIKKVIGIDDIVAIPLPSELELDEIEGLGTQDLIITEIARFVTTSAFYSFDFIHQSMEF